MQACHSQTAHFECAFSLSGRVALLVLCCVVLQQKGEVACDLMEKNQYSESIPGQYMLFSLPPTQVEFSSILAVS
jgi:hypothetical protein